MTSVRTGDSLELEDFELIEEFLVDECAPTTSTNGGASEQQVTVRDSDLEQSSNASGVDHYESQTPNIVYEDNGVLYKDDKGNFYRVVSQRPSYSETPRINDANKSPTAAISVNEERNSSSTLERRDLNPLKVFYLQVGENRLRFKAVAVPGRQKLKCEECRMVFITRAGLLNHNSSTHPESVFKCRLCYRSFLQQHVAEQHEKMHRMAKRYACHLCSKRFVKYCNYLIHLELHATGNSNFCPDCHRWFHEETMMNAHNVECVSRQRKHEMNNGQFSHEDDKDTSETSSSSGRLFSCELCEEGFDEFYELSAHLQNHFSPQICSECGDELSVSDTLNEHKILKHSGSSESTFSLSGALEASDSPPAEELSESPLADEESFEESETSPFG